MDSAALSALGGCFQNSVHTKAVFSSGSWGSLQTEYRVSCHVARGQGEPLALRCLTGDHRVPQGPCTLGLAQAPSSLQKKHEVGLGGTQSQGTAQDCCVQRALGAESGKDLWAEGALRGQVGRGHALCSGLAVKDRTEPQETGPCPYFTSGHNLGPPLPPKAPLTPLTSLTP